VCGNDAGDLIDNKGGGSSIDGMENRANSRGINHEYDDNNNNLEREKEEVQAGCQKQSRQRTGAASDLKSE
jgi:hypothetical protein